MELVVEELKIVDWIILGFKKREILVLEETTFAQEDCG
jgi:hypothetical protein